MIRPVLTVVVLLLAAAAAVLETVHVRVWWDRKKAEAAYYDGNLDEALALYERAAERRPDEPRSHNDLADSISQYLSGSGQALPREEFDALAKRAVRHYLMAIEAGPPGAWSFARLAILAEALQRSRTRGEAVDLSLLTGTPETLLPEERLAEAAWIRAVEIEPRNFYYRDFLGDFYLRRGFVDRALAHVRYSVRLHPVLDSHYFLSDSAVVSDEILDAVEAGIQDALEADDTFVSDYDVHRFLAALYLKMDRTDDAIASLEAAAGVAPLPHAIDVQIGHLWIEQGEIPSALRAFRRATEREPEYARAWLALGVTLSRVGSHEEAFDAAYTARGLEPGDYSISVALARVLEAGGDRDAAIDELETILLQHRDKPLAYRELIRLYETGGNLADATRVARRLVGQFPGEALYQEQLRQLEASSNKSP